MRRRPDEDEGDVQGGPVGAAGEGPPSSPGAARVVHFHGASYREPGADGDGGAGDGGGRPCSLTVSVRVEDGDAAGLIAAVAARGGVGATGEDGVYRMVPWPCAAVVVEEAADDVGEIQ